MRDIDITSYINKTPVNSALIGDLVLIQLSHILIFFLHNGRWVIVSFDIVHLDSFIDYIIYRNVDGEWLAPHHLPLFKRSRVRVNAIKLERRKPTRITRCPF
jgi:hypothetical protein